MAGALDGLVVLDLTTHLSGPFCGMQLGDLGADVIKIESPQGDSMRGAPPFVEGEGAPFMLWNRNKRGIRLDLKDAGDLEIFWDLVDGADVVLENFRPGVMKRLGLGWEALHARNPRLVLGSISGFGQTGPYAEPRRLRPHDPGDVRPDVGDRPQGRPALPHPARHLRCRRRPLSHHRRAGGASGARSKTGEGQWVETSLLEATVSLGVYEAANYFANGIRPPKLGQAHRGSSPYQVFQTSDGWLTIGGAQQNFFRKLCAMIGKPELADDPRFKTNAERVKNNDLIVGLLQAEVAKRSTADWMTALEAEGIPGRPGAASRRGLRRSADPGARHGGRGRARQGRQAEDAGRAAETVGDAGRRAPRRAGARPARRRDQESQGQGSETMVGAKGVLAALALSPAFVSAGALAQNGYSFTDAANSAVHYGAAPAKPAMSCASVASLATAETTIVSARVVPAADGVPEHCRVTGLIQPEIRFELNLPTNWNRRFYMHGNGGFAGEAPEFGARPMMRANALKQGFAVGPDQHRPRRHGRAARQLCRELPEARRLRLPRRAPDGGRGQAHRRRLLWPRRRLFLLGRLLDRRPPGPDQRPALPAGFRRHRRRRAGAELRRHRDAEPAERPGAGRDAGAGRQDEAGVRCRLCPLRRQGRAEGRPDRRSAALRLRSGARRGAMPGRPGRRRAA